MAKENIARFFNAAMTDKALAEKLAALAAKSGFEFTAEELLELGSARPIDDAEMENAAGGVPGNTPTIDWEPLFKSIKGIHYGPKTHPKLYPVEME